MADNEIMVMLPFKLIWDEKGRPTCKNKEHTCMFLRVKRFGQQEYCIYIDAEISRRLGANGPEMGTTIPHKDCPLWASRRRKEENE